MNILALMKDGYGLHGYFMHYSLVFALVGSAFLIFMHLWRKGRLDMDESPKFQMMSDSETEENGTAKRN